MTDDTPLQFTVEADRKGQRLDRFLADVCPELSRNRIKSLIRDGAVGHAGATIADPSYRVKPGACVTLVMPPPQDLAVVAQDIPLSVIFEDDHLIVVDKPAGMVVHPAPGNEDGTLVNALLAHCGDSLSGIGGVKRPGIVHRIDKDTSGLLVVAKSDQAHAGLSDQFAAHNLERRYQAIVWGCPGPREGRIEGNIGRNPQVRKKFSVVPSPHGKHAITNYSTIERLGPAASLVECRLETGRTHQIRVHMTHIGNPLIGDPVYGKPTKARLSKLSGDATAFLKTFQRQALHARVLGFLHPVSGERMSFSSELPEDMSSLKRVLE